MSEISFKISARTAGLIGKENIASAEGAIIELVKNSYDADATDCIIFFDNKNRGNKSLFIIDNGHGMDDKIIHDYWMTIGTSNKLHDAFSTNKRIKTGAKGIGRFALDRLGEKVNMFTLPLGKKSGFEWKADWRIY
ncbi:MAG: ATP-binding protein [Bacteroidia bacterium]